MCAANDLIKFKNQTVKANEKVYMDNKIKNKTKN